MLSESVDGQEAKRYLDMAPVKVECIMRPARATTTTDRSIRHEKYWEFLRLFKDAGVEAVAATAIEARRAGEAAALAWAYCNSRAL